MFSTRMLENETAPMLSALFAVNLPTPKRDAVFAGAIVSELLCCGSPYRAQGVVASTVAFPGCLHGIEQHPRGYGQVEGSAVSLHRQAHYGFAGIALLGGKPCPFIAE